MREILFRGKDIDKNKWVYGSYFAHQKVNLCIVTEHDEIEKNTQHLIVQDQIACDWNFKNGIQVIDVNPKTIGQYTGLKDKNGKKIFEGDILINDLGDKFLVELGFNEEHFFPVSKLKLPHKDCRIIIGNIHDNPELLEASNGSD